MGTVCMIHSRNNIPDDLVVLPAVAGTWQGSTTAGNPGQSNNEAAHWSHPLVLHLNSPIQSLHHSTTHKTSITSLTQHLCYVSLQQLWPKQDGQLSHPTLPKAE